MRYFPLFQIIMILKYFYERILQMMYSKRKPSELKREGEIDKGICQQITIYQGFTLQNSEHFVIHLLILQSHIYHAYLKSGSKVENWYIIRKNIPVGESRDYYFCTPY